MPSCVQITAAICLAFVTIACLINIVAINVPHFVDVHLTDDIDNQNQANRIGGLGVYQAEVDTTTASLAPLVEAAGFPLLKLSGPSNEFPLLFPVQKNFFADVLPFSLEDVLGLDAATGANGNFSAVIAPQLEAIGNVEFKNCDETVPEILNSLGTFFTDFQTDALPFIMFVASNLIKEGVENSTVANIELALSVLGLGQAFSGVFEATLSQVKEEVPACDFALTDDFNAQVGGCLLAGFNATPFETVQDIGLVLTGNFDQCVGITTIQGCAFALAPLFAVQDTFLDDEVAFQSEDICLVSDICVDGVTTKREFLSDVMIPFFTEIEQLEVAGLLFAYLQAFALLNLRFSDGIPLRVPASPTEADAGIPLDFGSSFPSCETVDDAFQVLQPLLAAQNITLPYLPGECVFSNFFEGLIFIVQVADPTNPLLSAVADLQFLYLQCQLFTDPNPPPLTVACPSIFQGGIFDGGFLGLEGEDQLAAGIAACKDDETDLEKISTAQGLIGASIAFGFGMLFQIFSGLLLSQKSAIVLYLIACLFGLLAGFAEIGALLTVESAPIYQSVGVEPQGLEPVFYEGYAGFLLFIAAMLYLFVGLAIGINGVVLLKKTSDEEKGGEVAPMKPVEP